MNNFPCLTFSSWPFPSFFLVLCFFTPCSLSCLLLLFASPSHQHPHIRTYTQTLELRFFSPTVVLKRKKKKKKEERKSRKTNRIKLLVLHGCVFFLFLLFSTHSLTFAACFSVWVFLFFFFLILFDPISCLVSYSCFCYLTVPFFFSNLLCTAPALTFCTFL